MSGGSLDYVYERVERAAELVLAEGRDDLLIRAFGEHLKKVAKALHDLEWVWSGDKSPGDETAAIQAVIGKQDEMAAAWRTAHEASEKYQGAMEYLRKMLEQS